MASCFLLSDDSSFDQVTCFCGKPYMGRPMIECSMCYNWLHLSCVHLRKSNIPETYICDACKRSPPHQQETASAKRRHQQRKLQASHTSRHKAQRNGDARTTPSPTSSSPQNNNNTDINSKSTAAAAENMLSSSTPGGHGAPQLSSTSFHTPPTAPEWNTASLNTPDSNKSSSYATPPSSAPYSSSSPAHVTSPRNYHASPVLQNTGVPVHNATDSVERALNAM